MGLLQFTVQRLLRTLYRMKLFVDAERRKKYAEIDLIAKKPDLLVFCEVKFRSSDRYGTGLEAVTVKKQQRIIKSARYFCNWYCGSKEFAYRFDVIAIEPQEKICHIENAFEL